MTRFENHDKQHSMTRHATTRGNQRGISAEVIGFVLSHFDRDHHAGAGAVAVSISRKRLLELEGVPATLLDRAARTVLIIADDGAIVTAINRPTWFSRFHHGAERLGHRQRFSRRSRRSSIRR